MNISTALPTKSLINLGLFCGIALLFLFIAVLPSKTASDNLDFEIDNIKMRIQEQRILTPVYETLLKKVTIEPPAGIAITKKEKLSREETQRIPITFQHLAEQANLELTDISPNRDSLLNESGYLIIDMVLRGEFINLHPFLIKLGQIPYVELIEKISIRSIAEAKEIKVVVWLAVQ
jgi:hypothetical protein